jgi:hypothetical protein
VPPPANFLPSRDAFAFTNAWPSQPAVVLRTPFGAMDVGDARGGLCGGMVFAALDYWHAGTAPPAGQPTQGQALYRFLVKRLVDSWRVPAGVAQYYQWMSLPDGDRSFDVLGRHIVTERGVSWRTATVQWPQIVEDLDAGAPVALGVVTVASRNPGDLRHNHQLLACGYTVAGPSVTVHVYDPNRGLRDDIFIRFDTSRPTEPIAFEHNLGLRRRVRGFFRTAYAPARPPDC